MADHTPAHLPTFVYKLISPASAFNKDDTVLPLSELDRNDGFYHLSTAAQVPDTANRYFPGSKFPELLVLKIRYRGIQPLVRWDPVPPNRVFPHVYGDLLQEHIDSKIKLSWDPVANSWDFSEGWEDRTEPL
ncbi:hypothetical protein DFQ27_000819 [Actinomortierella ambigua]|uniref:DUF952 domain-containing protein n=1 Tax=Actinomortierella ambigua TaxID=1343610 RepID=A0A9P6U9K9_9FUNG|nr:hypothetical protein DFQ27_000819 [Actinomortierella ambigua]